MGFERGLDWGLEVGCERVFWRRKGYDLQKQSKRGFLKGLQRV